MAAARGDESVAERFRRMGERFGWFRDGENTSAEFQSQDKIKKFRGATPNNGRKKKVTSTKKKNRRIPAFVFDDSSDSEPHSAPSTVKKPGRRSSLNLSAELKQATEVRRSEVDDLSFASTIVASQDQRRSMFYDTLLAFNPPAYSTICRYSDSSPEFVQPTPDQGGRFGTVPETDSELEIATVLHQNKPQSIQQIDQTDEDSWASASSQPPGSPSRRSSGDLGEVISALRGIHIKSAKKNPESVRKPRSAVKQRLLAASSLLLSSDEEDSISSSSPLHLQLSGVSPSQETSRNPAVLATDSSDLAPNPDRSDWSGVTRRILDSESSERVTCVDDTDERYAPDTEDSSAKQFVPDTEDGVPNTEDLCHAPDTEDTVPDTEGVSSGSVSKVSDTDNSSVTEGAETKNVSLQVSMTEDEGEGEEEEQQREAVEGGREEDEEASVRKVVDEVQGSPRRFPAIFFSDDDSEDDLPSILSPHWSNDSSSDDDAFENCSGIHDIQLQKKKTKASSPKKKADSSLHCFIVEDDDISSEENDSVFYAQANKVMDETNTRHKTPRNSGRRYTIMEDEQGLLFRTPKNPPSSRKKKKLPSSPRPLALRDMTNDSPPGVQDRTDQHYGFLASLTTNMSDVMRDPEAARFVKRFKELRQELSSHLFRLYNATVFDDQLPADTEVSWNVRMTKTAGYCMYKKNMPTRTGRWAKIDLSVKVCDSAERVRDTLIHEMCHAAVWLIHGKNDNHGRLWQFFARKAQRVHADLPAINRCHSYEISTKYTYKCSGCGYQIGRHSKSLDVTKKVCGYCRGTFEVLINTPRKTPQRNSRSTTPNKFALFVKENYARIKSAHTGFTHREIMRKLSEEFALQK